MGNSTRLVLTEDERAQLEGILRKGTHPARLMRRCQILLKAEQGLPNSAIAEHVRCALTSVANVRRRFAEGGLETALYDAPRPGAPAKFSEEQVRALAELAASPPPDARKRWTISLLCAAAVERGIVGSISVGSMHSLLKANGVDLKSRT